MGFYLVRVGLIITTLALQSRSPPVCGSASPPARSQLRPAEAAGRQARLSNPPAVLPPRLPIIPVWVLPSLGTLISPIRTPHESTLRSPRLALGWRERTSFCAAAVLPPPGLVSLVQSPYQHHRLRIPPPHQLFFHCRVCAGAPLKRPLIS